MRTAFMRTLTDLAADDPDLIFITGDLGFGVIEEFADKFPAQFFNAGVAEQSMTGMAAGLALSGKTVFTYSIANFPTIRCLEQVRNDVCYHHANVKIVAIGGGFAYGALGYSHHAVEDLAILRSLPNLTVVAPGDPVETEAATRALAALDGPAYLRLGKAGEPTCHEGDIQFELGKAIQVRDGGDVALISTGGMLRNTLDAADELARRGVSCRVLSMHTIRPLDTDAIVAAAGDCGAIVTVEEHSLVGGLGSAVAEVVVDRGLRTDVLRLGLPQSDNTHAVGSQDFLRERYGLDAAGLTERISSFVSRRRT